MIKLKNTTLEYPNFTLHIESLNVEKNEVLGIIGPSGSGKSSLVSLVSGLTSSSSGEVYVDGRLVTSVNPDVAIILQDYALLPWKTVYQNIAFILQERKEKNFKDTVLNTLTSLGISHLQDRYPSSLSGGEKQRVAIARALILKPKVLILDEAFSALDTITKDTLYDLLNDIKDKYQMTLLFITHNIEEAIEMSDRILIMKQGKIDNIYANSYKIDGEYEAFSKELKEAMRN